MDYRLLLQGLLAVVDCEHSKMKYGSIVELGFEIDSIVKGTLFIA